MLLFSSILNYFVERCLPLLPTVFNDAMIMNRSATCGRLSGLKITPIHCAQKFDERLHPTSQ